AARRVAEQRRGAGLHRGDVRGIGDPGILGRFPTDVVAPDTAFRECAGQGDHDHALWVPGTFRGQLFKLTTFPGRGEPGHLETVAALRGQDVKAPGFRVWEKPGVLGVGRRALAFTQDDEGPWAWGGRTRGPPLRSAGGGFREGVTPFARDDGGFGSGRTWWPGSGTLSRHWFPWVSHHRPIRAVVPPSTYRTWPVMKSALSDARNATVSPMSSGVPTRPAGTRELPNSLV